jgi:hypothetical protein
MHGRRLSILVFLGLILGCTPNLPIPGAADQSGDAGFRFCAQMEHVGRQLSASEGVFGWILAGLAIAALSAGSILTATNDSGAKLIRILGTCFPIVAALAGALALMVISRSNAASVLAEASTLALKEPSDRAAFEACIAARAAWVRSRTDGNAIALDLLKEQKDKRQQENVTLQSLKKMIAASQDQHLKELAGALGGDTQPAARRAGPEGSAP